MEAEFSSETLVHTTLHRHVDILIFFFNNYAKRKLDNRQTHVSNLSNLVFHVLVVRFRVLSGMGHALRSTASNLHKTPAWSCILIWITERGYMKASRGQSTTISPRVRTRGGGGD